MTPPDPQLTIVKIDNIQKNNKKKANKLTADNLQQITCKEIPAKRVACEGGVHEKCCAKVECMKGNVQRWSAC